VRDLAASSLDAVPAAAPDTFTGNDFPDLESAPGLTPDPDSKPAPATKPATPANGTVNHRKKADLRRIPYPDQIFQGRQ
jgi:hypothetical protein